MKKQIHLGQKIGQWFCFASEDALCLKNLPIPNVPALFFQMIVGFYKKASRATGRVKNGFSKPWINDFDHETDNRPRV